MDLFLNILNGNMFKEYYEILWFNKSNFSRGNSLQPTRGAKLQAKE